MLISTKGRYALRVLVDLAENQGDRYVPLKEIAQRQEISEKYLESILKILVQEKVLVGLRGKGGGYRLSRPADELTVSTVLLLTEESYSPVACLGPGSGPCEKMPRCRTYPMWKKLDSLLTEFFEGISIADLMQRDDSGNDYVI